MNPQIYSGQIPSVLFKSGSFSFANVSTNSISQTITLPTTRSTATYPQILNVTNQNPITGQSNGLWFGGLMLQPTVYFNITQSSVSVASFTVVVEGTCAGQNITDQVTIDLSNSIYQNIGTFSYPFFSLFEQINTISVICTGDAVAAATFFVSIAQYINNDSTMSACLGLYRPNIDKSRNLGSSIGFVNGSYVPNNTGSAGYSSFWSASLVGTNAAQESQWNPAYWATNSTGIILANNKQLLLSATEIQAATLVNINTPIIEGIYKYMTLKLTQAQVLPASFNPIVSWSALQ